MNQRDDVIAKSFAQFDVLMKKQLETINERFKKVEKPDPPAVKGKRVTPVRTPFDATI